MPHPVQLTVEKLVYGGFGLSREDGRVFLTPMVLPSEQITAEPVDKLHAKLIEITERSPQRVSPPCPYFGTCGGCHYQHAGYDFQKEAKVGILREVMRRVGHIADTGSIKVLSGPEWGYRNRTQLHIESGRIGYLRAGSHQLCPVDQCPISSPRLNESIAALNRVVADRRFPDFVRAVELFTNEQDVQFNVLDTGRPLARHFFDWIGQQIPGYAAGAIQYKAAGKEFRVGPRSFFQVNRFLSDTLVTEALEGAEGASALDLYAGVGLFSIALARQFQHVTAVESGASAAADLRHNAEAGGVEINAVRAASDNYLAGLEQSPDFILADPPREGLGKSTVKQLLRVAPRRLHIVACDPATLARDLSALLAGGFRLERMSMVDLFPETYHLETIAFLVRD